jgi:hypothetical protein
MAEIKYYDWFLQWPSDEWEPWLLEMPDEAMNVGWSKMRWCNWYFKCRQYERKLILDNQREFLLDMANFTIEEEIPWSKRRRDEV